METSQTEESDDFADFQSFSPASDSVPASAGVQESSNGEGDDEFGDFSSTISTANASPVGVVVPDVELGGAESKLEQYLRSIVNQDIQSVMKYELDLCNFVFGANSHVYPKVANDHATGTANHDMQLPILDANFTQVNAVRFDWKSSSTKTVGLQALRSLLKDNIHTVPISDDSARYPYRASTTSLDTVGKQQSESIGNNHKKYQLSTSPSESPGNGGGFNVIVARKLCSATAQDLNRMDTAELRNIISQVNVLLQDANIALNAVTKERNDLADTISLNNKMYAIHNIQVPHTYTLDR